MLKMTMAKTEMTVLGRDVKVSSWSLKPSNPNVGARVAKAKTYHDHACIALTTGFMMGG